VDERVHAALRGDRARLGQLQISIESELRPREIQARIRAGFSAEQIAQSAGLSVAKVERFAGPVVQERSYVAQQACLVGVRRLTDSVSTPLGDLVSGRLAERGVAADDLRWDSWRRDDGRWQLVLEYPVAEKTRSAAWVYDPMRRTVDPDDEEARWLTDEERAAPEPPRQQPARLTAVPAPEPDPSTQEHDTVPVLTRATVEEPGDLPAAEEPAAVAEAATEADDEPAIAPRRPTRGGRRAAVPSWDEILFGAGTKRDE
jgi:hypothetical protein